MQPLYAPQPIGPPSVPAPPPPPPAAPLSGKSTPRQPAKKRLEARTPTIDELGVPSAFKALHDTPFSKFGTIYDLFNSLSNRFQSLKSNYCPFSTGAWQK